jgi:glutamate N-acetyltransferase/amino-acid N-acetyltransferase
MSVTSAPGFVAAGVHAGVKGGVALDLSLVATADGQPVSAAGVFTANLMTAAPVTVTRAHLSASAGQAAGVILNAGNANAATGEKGCDDAETMCDLVAAELGVDRHHVLVCSTGLIGIPLPSDVISAAIPSLVAKRAVDGATDAAEAIRTTDTHRKEAQVVGDGFAVGGMAKGAAMLAPNLATMLAVLTTDAAVEPGQLAEALRAGVAGSFNAMSSDGCTSTNDTVILLASGEAGLPVDPAAFAAAVADVCLDLATQMVGDAEGHTKVVTVRVTGAMSDDEAHDRADLIAELRAEREVAAKAAVEAAQEAEAEAWLEAKRAAEAGETSA